MRQLIGYLLAFLVLTWLLVVLTGQIGPVGQAEVLVCAFVAASLVALFAWMRRQRSRTQ